MDDKKELIMDVARDRFDHYGVKKTTMDEIANDAGISKRTVYERFKNKEDLFISVFIREALKNRDLILKELAGITDPLERITKMARLAVKRHWQETFMIKVLRDENGHYAPYLKESYRLQVENGILHLFSRELQRGIDRNLVRPLDTHTVSYCIFKLFQSFTFAKTASIKGDEADLEELIRFVLNGLRPTSG